MADDEWKCPSCKKEITPEQAATGFDKYNYHEGPCWRCGGGSEKGCKIPFKTGEAFYGGDEGTGYTEFPFHEKCIPGSTVVNTSGNTTGINKTSTSGQDTDTKCDGCGSAFKVGEDHICVKSKTSATTLNFHDKCFICNSCKEPIGEKAYALSHGKIIHDDVKCTGGAIASKTMGSNEFSDELVCTKCGEKITGRSKTIPGIGTFHLSCTIKCSRCNLGLGETATKMPDGAIVCHRCTKK